MKILILVQRKFNKALRGILPYIRYCCYLEQIRLANDKLKINCDISKISMVQVRLIDGYSCNIVISDMGLTFWDNSNTPITSINLATQKEYDYVYLFNVSGYDIRKLKTSELEDLSFRYYKIGSNSAMIGVDL